MTPNGIKSVKLLRVKFWPSTPSILRLWVPNLSPAYSLLYEEYLLIKPQDKTNASCIGNILRCFALVGGFGRRDRSNCHKIGTFQCMCSSQTQQITTRADLVVYFRLLKSSKVLSLSRTLARLSNQKAKVLFTWEKACLRSTISNMHCWVNSYW